MTKNMGKQGTWLSSGGEEEEDEDEDEDEDDAKTALVGEEGDTGDAEEESALPDW
eukprot:CAMPEP_0201524520 /NCGR_PEP_ID=MMETSP0161_2-20130828/23063_1 /ASSEMBLY_ACC=CAM_ASM_000251 /TAXON_ID=180227 /ORGANISM="Neoparamoeba aestuarina, Strain SoJaBio B1-5/56/2" /LENGTH=54 /DNA_ID=CAMNT_0047923971 /DNA_START=65 /DNA_END=226 /DNA_ORIENTATION=+